MKGNTNTGFGAMLNHLLSKPRTQAEAQVIRGWSEAMNDAGGETASATEIGELC